MLLRVLQGRAKRRFEAMLDRIDDHLGSISDTLFDAVERSDEVRANAVPERELTWEALASGRSDAGYEAELEREVNRARATGRPLSLIVLDVHDLAGSDCIERTAADLTTLLGGIVRENDKVVRRGHHEIVVLLRGAPAEAAWRFHGRLRGELERSFEDPGDKLTVLTDVVEWTPNDTGSLGTRAQPGAE